MAEIKIGDRFYKGGKSQKLYEVVDIIRQFSTAQNKWYDDVIYIARGIDTLATNSFDVSKTTILRGRINN